MTSYKDLEQNLIDANLLKVLDVTPAPIIVSRLDGSFEYVNVAFLNMLGYSAEEIYEDDIVVSHPDELLLNEKIRESLHKAPFTPITLEKRYLHKSGKEVIGLLTMVAEPDEEGKVKRFIAQIINITEHKVAQQNIEIFRALINKSNDSMIVFDPLSGLVRDANQECCEQLGYSIEELQEKTVKDIDINMSDQTVWSEHVESVKKSGGQILEAIQKRKDGSCFPVEISVSYVELEQDSYMLAIIRDISERRKKDETIWHQANYDSLTNLPNRDMLQDRLGQQIKRLNKKIAILCLDIDHFKDINDSFGHHSGDKLLIEIAKRIKNCTRDCDTVARLGGDEFAIVIDELEDSKYIEKITENILEALLLPIDLGIHKAFVSGSIGITIYPNDSQSTEELLKNADQAMYEVKNNGRNGYKYFTQYMHDKALARVQLINDLHRGIENKEFEMVYQPIINMENNNINKAEALIRWNHPTRGKINPDEFIPIAEESNLIVEIGRWVFEEVSKQMYEWKKQNRKKLQININMSPIQFSHKSDEFIKKWLKELTDYGLEAKDFTIEITEGVMMNMYNTEGIGEKLLLMREAGVNIALDDFGTGYSSLAYLKKLDIDYIKIDRTFVLNLKPDSDNLALCEVIIMLAEKFNLKVVAEGIESEEQYQLLQDAGCNYGQGFLFSRPLTAKVFTDLFVKKNA